jgi:hypothetical protein
MLPCRSITSRPAASTIVQPAPRAAYGGAGGTKIDPRVLPPGSHSTADSWSALARACSEGIATAASVDPRRTECRTERAPSR